MQQCMVSYHLSKHEYKIGDVIQKGHWKAYLDKNKANDTVSQFEEHMEKLRLLLGSDKFVSRLQCVFSFPDSSTMENYALSRNGTIYEVETESKCSSHNYNIITYFSKMFNKNNFTLLLKEEELMKDYWLKGAGDDYSTSNGTQIEYMEELLISGSPTILNKF